jgi:putative DNA primase/helicase
LPFRRPPEIHQTDVGNGRCLVERHGDDLRYCYPWRQWLVWDGRRWRLDETAAAVRRAKDTVDAMFREAADQVRKLGGALAKAADEHKPRLQMALDNATAQLTWWTKSEDARRINAMLEMARSEEGIPVLPDQLDNDPFLLNVLNGTLDLRTGRLGPHRREDYLTKMCPVEYRADARCPQWEKCLARVMDDNDDLVGYLQRVTGYGLTGDVREQCLWFLHGTGANGKSTFLGTVLAMLGDYGMQAVSELLLAKRSESHPTERADLFGRRLVATIEVDEGKGWAEALMKQLTGGDKVRARWCFKDFFEFPPTWKIFLAANHKPAVRGTDHGNWRRIKLIPFTVTIPEEEQDKTLGEKLRAELPGILAWAVRGCLEWQREGLGEPEEVRRATDAYRAEQDTLGAFLEEACFVHPEAKVQASKLLEVYQEWSGDKLMTQKTFAARLEERGYVSRPGHANRKYYHGLGLPET